MGKFRLLSLEVSRCRSLVAAGSSTTSVLQLLRQWCLQAPVRGMERVPTSLVQWAEQLMNTMTESIGLGAPVGKLLQEVHPMIRNQEKRWKQLLTVEQQFGFQAAIALVIPWSVCALGMSVRLNVFTISGACLQFLGLFLFYWVVRRVLRSRADERSWLFHFLTLAWMRVLSGLHLRVALESSLKQCQSGDVSKVWQSWFLTTSTSVNLLERFQWPKELERSKEAASFLGSLLLTGAPAQQILSDYIKQLEDERQTELENTLALLPTRMSLLFCVVFTPSMFLILLGSLWPQLNVLMT